MTANEYPGNRSLSTETKQRVIDTFDQALGLFDEARMDEVVAGCDLILQIDDRFEPAVRLRTKAKDPGAAVDLSDLAQYRSMKITGGEDEPDASDDELISRAREALDSGDYQTAIDSCNIVLGRSPGNEEAQALGAKAYEKVEAAPFVTQYMDEANAAIDSGDADTARTAIDKAKSLDESHPDIAAAESRLAETGTSAPEEETAEPEAPAGDAAGGFDFGASEGGFASEFAADTGTEEQPAPEPSEASEPATGSAFTTEEDAATPGTESPDPGVAAEPDDSEASTFGFTLEDSPGEEAVTPEPEPEPEAQPEGGGDSSFDFSVGEVSVSEDDQSNIDKYLQEGDDLFEAGNYPGAIDAWSKIFLIDVTNEEANSRIEKAKEKKRESESELDELLDTGIAAFERGDYRTAEQTFQEVLAEDPDNYKAQEYLEKLKDHQAATGEAGADVPPPPPAGDMYGDPGDVYEGAPPEGVFSGTPEGGPPPPPSAAAEDPVAIEAPSGKSGRFLMILIVLLLLGGGGYLAWTMFFEGEPEPVAVETNRETEGKITRARIAYEEGRFEQTIELLSTIPSSDPLHSEAVELLANARQRQQQRVAAEKIELFDSLITRGRQAMAEEDYAGAKEAFEQAAEIQDLEPDDLRALSVARREMGELQAATNLLEQGNYAAAIANLETILEREPENTAARRLAGFAWYNRGVRSLREENDLASALEYFRQALRYLPGDRMTQRSIEFIEKYREQRPDLQYEIYRKYLAYK